MSRKFSFFIILFYLILFYPACAFASGSISGKVTLQSRTNHQGLITFRLTIPGESTPFRTHEATTASDGSYTLTDVPVGIYNLSAKHQIFLRKNQILIEVIEGQTTPDINFNLLGGDCDGNNVINAFDKSILNKAFGSTEGSPKWDPRADFDANKVINAFDKSVLNSNFSKSGAEPQITITFPQDNTFTNASSITVSGTINDSACQVTVNNIPAQVANNIFTAPNIPLTEGQNRISAIATNTRGNKNADLHIVTFDTTAPSQPQGLSANAGDSKADLFWTANAEPDLAGYNIYRSATQGTGYAKVNSATVIGTTYEDTGLTNGTTYYYVITALDQATNESASSNEVSVTPPSGSSYITTIDYSYDDLNRLENAADGQTSTTYTYDEVGNITNKTTERAVP